MKNIIIASIFLIILMAFYLKFSEIVRLMTTKKEVVPGSPPLQEIDEVEEYLFRVKEMCGELCDYTKEVVPGKLLGTVSSKINCESVFNIDQVPYPSKPGAKPPTWSNTHQVYRDTVSHRGEVAVKEWYFDETNFGFGMGQAQVFSKEYYEILINRWKNRTHQNDYVRAHEKTDDAAEAANVTGKVVLVIGSQSPWLEAVLITRGAAKIVTLEYGSFISQYPTHQFIKPKQFREQYLSGDLDKFDIVFTYSSLEHSGLGRYGDTLNPWADTLAIAQAWCVSTPDARLAVGVPYSSEGDRVEYNAHRVYGPVMYPFLATNWEAVWVEDENKRTDAEKGNHLYQPYFVFKKL